MVSVLDSQETIEKLPPFFEAMIDRGWYERPTVPK